MLRWIGLRVVAAAVLTANQLLAVPASAQTWTGATSDAWATGSNWTGGAEPGGAATVTINTNATPNAPLVSVAGEVAGLLLIGSVAGSTGTLTITGAGTLTTNNVPGAYVGIGESGTGTVTVSAGGTFTTNSGFGVGIGNQTGSTGTVTVTGANSRWTSSVSIDIGSSGNGTLNVQSGGVVTGTVFNLGNDATNGANSGQLNISGSGSRFTASISTNIGNAVGDSGAVVVSGAGAQFQGAQTTVGGGGTGTLSIESGASGTASQMTIGNAAQGTATVTGAGSTLAVTAALTAASATTGSLMVSAGGVVTSGSGAIGAANGGNGTVTVTGTNSRWTITNALTMGGGTTGTGTLSVLAGGTVAANSLTGVNSAKVTVDGAGSQLTLLGSSANTTTFTMGTSGAANELKVTNGATLTTRFANLTTVAGTSATALVDDAGSTWNAGAITLAGPGTSTLTVSDGAIVNVNTGPLPSITIDGTNSSVTITSGGQVFQGDLVNNTGQLAIGSSSTGTLLVNGGADLSSRFTVLAENAGSTGTATVTGVGSTWTNRGIQVAFGGTGSLTINGGALVTSNGSSVLGFLTGSQADVLVSGAGTQWLSTVPSSGLGNITVGNGGTATMRVEAGAVVAADGIGVGASHWDVVVGDGNLHPGNGHLVATGAGTRLDVNVSSFQSFDAGGDGGTGLIEILDGAVVTVVGQGHLGQSSIFAGANPQQLLGSGTLTVDGTGSRVTYTQTLDIGEHATGILNIRNGGYVSNQDAYLGSFTNSVGSAGNGTANISGTGTQWVNRDLRVGDQGTGTLNVTAGALVSTRNSRIASSTGAVGTATIDGAGSAWTMTGTLVLGTNGTGTLNVRNGGSVTATGAMTINALSTVNIGNGGTSGSLSAASITNNGTLAFNHSDTATQATVISGSGTLTKTGTGTRILSATNTYTGTTTVSGGQLTVNGAIASSAVSVQSGGALGGSGSVGTTTVANGGTLVGVAAQTLTASALTLNGTSNLNVALGAPNTNPIFQVNGNLTADGSLNVTNAGGFALGTYRLFNYTGALTYNGIVITSVPAGFNPGDWGIDFLSPGQINLVAAGGPGIQYWDGVNMSPGGVANGRGGDGTWNAANTNWTNQAGTLNAAWAGQRAVFAGTAGTVSVVGEQVFSGLKFTTAAASWTYTLNPGLNGALRTDSVGTEIEVVANPGIGAEVAVLFVPVTGTGSIVKMGGGQLTLAAANSYSGGTRIIDGTVNVLVNGGLSTGPVVIDGTGTPVQRPQLNYTSPLNPVSGGSNTVSVLSGDLFFNNNTSAGALAITIGTDGDVWFNEGSAAGTSTITVNNGGDLFFRGASEARGARVINNAGGDINISTASQPGVCNCVALGSLSGAGAVAILDGTLVIGALGLNDEISGPIVGGGGLTKEGTGTLILSGGNIYAGATTVAAGILAVNGTLAAPTVVNVLNGGTLKGIGTLTTTSVAAGGIHAPGNSIGTQTVMGNYVLGGTLQVEINPTAADKVIVTGDVTLTGSTLDVMEETQFGWQPNQRFTIIDNQGPNAVVGTFATVRNVYAFLTPTVSYTGDDGNNVVLSIARNQVSFPAAGLTPNQIAAGAGAESTGPQSPVYLALVGLPAASVPNAFDQISGEVHASIKAGLVEDTRFLREAIVQRTHKIFEDEDELGAWMQAYGAIERRAGDGNAAAVSFGTGGLLFGGDGVGDNGWYVGVVGGIGHTQFSIPDRNSTASSDNAHVAAYATGSLKGVVLRLGAGVTQHSIQTTRTPAFQGFGETLTARYDATTAQVFGEIGYPLDVAGLTVEPFVGLAGIFQHTNGFTETGGISALTAPASSYGMAVASIGVRVSDSFVLSNGMEVEAFGSVSWRQAFGSTPTSTQAFAGGQNFTVASAPLNGGALNVEIGAGIKFSDSARLDLSYSGQFSGGSTSHAAKATLHIAF